MNYRGKYVSGKSQKPLSIKQEWEKELSKLNTYDYFVVLNPTKNFPEDELITGINRLIHWLNKYYYRYNPDNHITGVIKKEWEYWKDADDWRRYYSEKKTNKIPFEKRLHYHLLLKVDDSKKKKLPVMMKKLCEKLFHTETVIKPKKGKDIFHSEILGSKEELLFQEPYVEKIISQKASVKYLTKTKLPDILYAEFYKDYQAETGINNIGFITKDGIVGI